MNKQGSPMTDGFSFLAPQDGSGDNQFLVRSQRGVYTPPRAISIAGIPGVVVDPHHEVFPFWWSYSQGRQAVVLHVDNHSDIQADVPLLSLEARMDTTAIQEDTRRSLTIASFIAPAVHYQVTGPVYWIDPRRDFSYTYGRIRQGELLRLNTAIREKDGKERIQWDPVDENIPLTTELRNGQLVKELQTYTGPLIVDIDLDAFDCVTDRLIANYPLLRMRAYEQGDPRYRYPISMNPEQWPGVRHSRIRKTLELLAALPRPGLITIARSQTPCIFTPAASVDFLEAQTIAGLTELYQS